MRIFRIIFPLLKNSRSFFDRKLRLISSSEESDTCEFVFQLFVPYFTAAIRPHGHCLVLSSMAELVFNEAMSKEPSPVGSSIIHDKWMTILDREDCSYDMFCEDVELLLEMAHVLTHEEENREILKIMPKSPLLEDIFVNATKCFEEDMFQTFLEKRMDRFGTVTIIEVEFDSEFQTLMNKSKNDTKSVSYSKLLSELMSKISCSPGETLFYILSRGLEIPTFLPIAAQMLSNTFRSVCFFKNDIFTLSQITSIFKYKTSVAIMDTRAIINFTKELNKSKFRKYGSAVLDIELLVMSWCDTLKLNKMIFRQFELLNQLLVSNVIGKDRWCKLDIPRFIIWFYGAIVVNSEMKDFLIETLGLIMNGHVQRKISSEEFDQIKKLSCELLDWDDVWHCYLLPYLEEDATRELKTAFLETTEILVMIAITGKYENNSILFSKNVIDSLASVFGQLSKTEIMRLFDYTLKSAAIEVVVSLWAVAIGVAQDQGKSVESVIRHFVLVVKERWDMEEDDDYHDSDDESYDNYSDRKFLALEALEELKIKIEEKLNEENIKQLNNLYKWVEYKIHA